MYSTLFIESPTTLTIRLFIIIIKLLQLGNLVCHYNNALIFMCTWSPLHFEFILIDVCISNTTPQIIRNHVSRQCHYKQVSRDHKYEKQWDS